MNRAALHWAAFFLSTAAVLSVAVALQSFSEVAAHHFDLTLQRRLSLSEYGASVLERLNGPLQIDFYYRRGERMRARDLLDLLQNESARVHYELIDIDRNPLRARQNGVPRFDRALLTYEDRELVTPAATEEALIGGIAQILEQRRPVLYFLNNHGERTTRVGHDDQLGRAARILRGEGYDILPLSLLETSAVPPDAAAVVVAGPETDFITREISMLDSYLERGGSVLVLVDPVELPRLEGWIASHGLRLADDVVIDQEDRVYGSDGTNVLVRSYRETHPVVASLHSEAVLGRARSVATVDGGSGTQDAAAQVVARTGSESFLARGAARTRRGAVQFDPRTDRPGPVGVMGVSWMAPGNAERGGRLVVIGDADFASDDFVALLGNKDLLVNVVGWLTEREAEGARARPDTAGLGPLSPVFVSERLSRAIVWSTAIVQPGVVFIVGVVVVLWRRRRR